jgi:hypothetical protein
LTLRLRHWHWLMTSYLETTLTKGDMDDYIFMVKCVISLLFFDISHSNTIKLNVIGRPERLRSWQLPCFSLLGI